MRNNQLIDLREKRLTLSRRFGDTYTATNSKGSLYTKQAPSQINYRINNLCMHALRLKRLFEN